MSAEPEPAVTRKLSYSLAFSIVVTGVIAYAMWETRNFAHSQAGQFPRIIAIPVLVMCALQIALEVRRTVKRVEPRQIMDLVFESDLDPKEVSRRVVIAFGWVLGFIATVVFVGFHIAIIVMVPSYLMVRARVRWYWALVGLAAIWIMLILIFNQLLHTNVPVGRFIQWP